jgi:hypothetical protein
MNFILDFNLLSYTIKNDDEDDENDEDNEGYDEELG